MTAETVAIGTELLLGEIVDTNSAELARTLASFGVFSYHRQVVGDNVDRIAEAVRLALSRSDLVFTIGGLGPTQDDVTREGVARALGEELVLDQALDEGILQKLRSRGISVSKGQSRQAMRPSCAEAIDNPNGTAPGLICQKSGKTVIAMPGPKLEFVPMLRGPVSGHLRNLGLLPLVTRTIRLVGIGESLIEEKIIDLMSSDDPTVAPYAKTGEVHLRIASQSGGKRMQEVEREIVSRLSHYVYGFDDETLESVVIDLLRKRRETLATAESCTGGGLGARVTSVPGSSDVFLGCVVTYSNELKMSLLGVLGETLDQFGAVSKECAQEMATGARESTGASWAISVTGIAGPDGGTDEKPVGLVYIGLAGQKGTTVAKHQFPGTREGVRERSIQAALCYLWNAFRDN